MLFHNKLQVYYSAYKLTILLRYCFIYVCIFPYGAIFCISVHKSPSYKNIIMLLNRTRYHNNKDDPPLPFQTGDIPIVTSRTRFTITRFGGIKSDFSDHPTNCASTFPKSNHLSLRTKI